MSTRHQEPATAFNALRGVGHVDLHSGADLRDVLISNYNCLLFKNALSVQRNHRDIAEGDIRHNRARRWLGCRHPVCSAVACHHSWNSVHRFSASRRTTKMPSSLRPEPDEEEVAFVRELAEHQQPWP